MNAIEQELLKIESDARASLTATTSLSELDQAKAKYVGKAGTVTALAKTLGKLPAEERPTTGAAVNAAKRSSNPCAKASSPPSSTRGSRRSPST